MCIEWGDIKCRLWYRVDSRWQFCGKLNFIGCELDKICPTFYKSVKDALITYT